MVIFTMFSGFFLFLIGVVFRDIIMVENTNVIICQFSGLIIYFIGLNANKE